MKPPCPICRYDTVSLQLDCAAVHLRIAHNSPKLITSHPCMVSEGAMRLTPNQCGSALQADWPAHKAAFCLFVLNSIYAAEGIRLTQPK